MTTRRAANSRFPTLPAADLAKALRMAELARGWLQEAYKTLKPHHALATQCEIAGKAAKRLGEGIKARQQGTMP